MIVSIIDQYGIRSCILSAVYDSCNDMAALFTQKNMFSLPCACHLINIFLRISVRPYENIIKEMSTYINSLKSPSTYAYLRDETNDQRIASYLEIS